VGKITVVDYWITAPRRGNREYMYLGRTQGVRAKNEYKRLRGACQKKLELLIAESAENGRGERKEARRKSNRSPVQKR
jgi:hypothetical protein